MQTQDSQNSTRRRSMIAGLVVLGLGLAFWLLREPSPSSPGAPKPPTPDAERQPEPPPSPRPAPRAAPPAAARAVTPKPAPAARPTPRRISSSGRLSTTRAALRDGDALVLILEMDDEARGAGPRPAKLVHVGGRVLETTATPLPGTNSGVRLEIDPAWLGPGHYLIQVETAERRPLALRRYFLEVLE